MGVIQTIPAGAHTWQSDVETAHRLIEDHLYFNEVYKSREDFLNKVGSYLLMFNSIRKNSYKENKSPWQLIQEENTCTREGENIKNTILNLPPFRLDYLFERMPMAVGGYHHIHHPSRSDDGRDSRDTFLSLNKTCFKLKISFWNYLLDRVNNTNAIKPLSQIIAQAAFNTS